VVVIVEQDDTIQRNQAVLLNDLCVRGNGGLGHGEVAKPQYAPSRPLATTVACAEKPLSQTLLIQSGVSSVAWIWNPTL